MNSVFFFFLGVQTPIRFDEFDAHTPTSSGYNHAETLLSYEDDLSLQCSCRMKIEEEEDKLFAHTLAVSYVQDGLPLVPHLSFTDEENDIVRCQNEVCAFLLIFLRCYSFQTFSFKIFCCIIPLKP